MSVLKERIQMLGASHFVEQPVCDDSDIHRIRMKYRKVLTVRFELRDGMVKPEVVDPPALRWELPVKIRHHGWRYHAIFREPVYDRSIMEKA